MVIYYQKQFLKKIVLLFKIENIMKKIILYLFIILATTYLFSTNIPKNISSEKIIKIKKKYGKKAERRVILWDRMLEKTRGQKTIKKLKSVNDFFNKIKYLSDEKVWKQEDYWASPFEFLGVGAGDCEDFAIAKYFALRALGIPEEKLKITYVTLTQKNKSIAHMVLNYYHKPTSTPIILDSLNKKLKLATKRKDLKPIYSFNASGLWEAKHITANLKCKGKNKLEKWQSMMSRI